MQTTWGQISRRFLTVSATLALLLTASEAFAATSSASLTVTATVTSSIQLLLDSNAGGVTLTGSGTNAATLPFGTISQYGSAPSGVTISSTPASTLCTTCWSAATPVTVVVNQSDGSSPNFTLAASVASYGGSEKIALGTSSALTTTPATILPTASYGSGGNTVSVILGVQNTGGTSVTGDVISLTATAN